MNTTTTVLPCVAAVLMVDPFRRVLLQHRDANAPASPNMWSAPGGHMEPGETPQQTAHREILEETGLHIEQELILFLHLFKYLEDNGSTSHVEVANANIPADRITLEMYVFCTTTNAVESDLILGEGQALAFKSPEESLKLDLALSMRYALPLFFASPRYQALLTAHRSI